MTGWSAENATKAYLGAMEMGKGLREPDSAEFISAMVAGANARLIVVACADAAEPTVLALAAAARQTDGKVVCILHGDNAAEEALGPAAAENVEFVVGNAEDLISSEYKEADCVAVDCRISDSERILRAARNTTVVGYNAFWTEPWRCRGFDARWLPIGQGLLLNRRSQESKKDRPECGLNKRARWVVRVDRFTGEEHIFMLREKHPKPT